MSDIPLLGFDDVYDEHAVNVDLTQLIASRLLIQANSGGGKSWAGRFLLEGTAGRVSQLIIDPEGEYSSLREIYPYVVIGGDGGDLPAHVVQADSIVRRLVERDVSAIIDLSDLNPDDRRRYVRRFIGALMELPRELWRPYLVVIDEIHIFAPERGYGESEALEAVTALATRGRKRGFALAGFTQRLAKLHNDVAAELNNVLIGRTWLDTDVRRAGLILGLKPDQRQAMKHLDPGTFFAFGPAISRDVLLVRTGAVRTRHPQPGMVAAPAPPPPAELATLLSELREVAPPPPPPDVGDLETAKDMIADLQRQLVERPPVVERVEVQAISDELRSRIEQLAEALTTVGADLLAALRTVVAAPESVPVVEKLSTASPPILPSSTTPNERARLLRLGAVQAKMRQAAVGIDERSAAQIQNILEKTWDRSLRVDEIAEARGTLSSSTLSRIRKAAAALVKVKLLVTVSNGRYRVNLDEIERLRELSEIR